MHMHDTNLLIIIFYSYAITILELELTQVDNSSEQNWLGKPYTLKSHRVIDQEGWHNQVHLH